MKHIQSFSLFEAQTSVLTTDQEAFLNEFTDGTWSVNPTTGLVDVQGDFNCFGQGLKSLRKISFGHVSGYFSFSDNQLTSLAGAPQTVSGHFFCSRNQLTSLKGAPQTVDGPFYCYKNKLTSLEGAPQTVYGDFRCYNNQLTSLEGAPQTVGGDFSCYNNQLTSLEGAPQTVGGYFTCDEFQLDSGEWNMEGWLRVLKTGKTKAKKLILTLPWLQPDWWNSELQRDPGKTVHLLGSLWKHMPKDMQSGIKIPRGYEGDFELFSGFDELGLF
jgi:hypothetical protein